MYTRTYSMCIGVHHTPCTILLLEMVDKRGKKKCMKGTGLKDLGTVAEIKQAHTFLHTHRVYRGEERAEKGSYKHYIVWVNGY